MVPAIFVVIVRAFDAGHRTDSEVFAAPQTAQVIVGHLLGNLLGGERAVRVVPLQNPVDAAEDGKARELYVLALEFARADTVLDQLAHTALEFVALADVAFSRRRANFFEISLQDAAKSLVDDATDMLHQQNAQLFGGRATKRLGIL